MVAFASDSLNKLCSADQLELLNSVDRLRQQGINNYVSLPQIIVCGDQSSGKSSVLEAISGVSFPVKSNACTRFPTELVLRRGPSISAKVSIVPHESRSDSERNALQGFQEKMEGFDDLQDVIEKAKLVMGISTYGKTFSKDILRVELTGPDRPHLTIVDLPGLIHSETKHQSASDVELIQDVVRGYMRQSRCIILAVISAKNDFANQVVLKLARDADKNGDRTLGVITKPDTLVPGSDSETLYVSLAKNQEVKFRLGWHALKNMDTEKGKWSLAERDAEETRFFSDGAWAELPLVSLGIETLRTRLSKLLLRQITSELPGLIKEIEGKFDACQKQLETLGKPRETIEDQRLYLTDLSQNFQVLVKASIDGTYNDPFFTDAKTKNGYRQRIRAVIQNLSTDFASDLSRRGHARKIIGYDDDDEDDEDDTDDEDTDSGSNAETNKITRDGFLDHIRTHISRTRGRELPGTFNPMIVADLFQEQSQPWEAIARAHVKKVWDAAYLFINLVVAHIADASTSVMLHRKIFGPGMKDILKDLEEKSTEVLAPHKSGHPITYNHYFTETLQKLRRERRVKASDKVVMDFFGVSALTSRHHVDRESYDLRRLSNMLSERWTEPNMEISAAQDALDCMKAYYKVALKRFIDDVAVEVIEGKLVSALHKILSPVRICRMPDDQISLIAGESEDTRIQRTDLSCQLLVLRKGLETCKRLVSLKFNKDFVFESLEDADEVTMDGYDSDLNAIPIDSTRSESSSVHS